jgi:hypothetical protein
MSIKQKLSEVESRRRDLEVELQKIIEDKVLQFQKDNNVAIVDFMVFTREIPKTLSQSEIPPFCYVDDVEITIDREHFLLNNVD